MDFAVTQQHYASDYPPAKLLQERFHIATGFHSDQCEIIEHLVQGKRVLAIQRTGWGKSLCYQMASLYYPHLTIVFSPLKALMRDQCQRCNESYTIPSAIVSSDFTAEENKATLEQAVAGSIKLLFIAPERLDNVYWQTYVSHMRISMIVIDEAHCISTWGHDFRPDYRRIVRLLATLPKNTPVLALTATANKRVEGDILQQIGKTALVIRGTLQRPNLYLNAVQMSSDVEKLSYLGEVLSHRHDTGIIYTATRNAAEMVAAFLRYVGVNAVYYHADREDHVRQDIEQKLMGNYYQVVCSTSALGMGIDKPDIRFVVHYNITASPIHYYQEMGRAGRDGDISWCVLLYDPTDLMIQKHFIDNARPQVKFYETILRLLRVKPHDVYELMQDTGFSKTAIRTMLADLEEQHLVKYRPKLRVYSAIDSPKDIDLSKYESVRLQKEQELSDIQNYALADECYMGYLTTYLGDQPDYHCGVCGHCQRDNFPYVKPSERIQTAAIRFLEEEFLPPIERRSIEERVIHEAGWSLAYYGKSRVGQLVRASKYEDAGPFPLGLVYRSVEVLRTRYPVGEISGIVSIPPTKSGLLVEMLARQIASLLQKEYLPVLAKVRATHEQKELTNRVQKFHNVKGAFCVRSPAYVAGRSLLVIDDIYDSGQMLREVGQTLMQAGAKAVYPFTLTRTSHSDDQ